MSNIDTPRGLSDRKHYIFAGGGTGGHIYPALAVAQKIKKHKPNSCILFICCRRLIDSRILSASGFDFISIPARGFTLNPIGLILFFAHYAQSYEFARRVLIPIRDNAVVVGTGGFAAAPVIKAAAKLKIPSALINVDMVPGKANKFIASKVSRIYTQFERTGQYFGRNNDKARPLGCPLRPEFESLPSGAKEKLGLDPRKKTILVTGASSGAVSVNNAFCEMLPMLSDYVETWQVIHLTGIDNYPAVEALYRDISLPHKLIDYYDNTAELYSAADIIVGRGGAVSVAEYAAAGKPVICLPYPYHRDRHQYLNIEPLVEAGAAVVVDDNAAEPSQTAKNLCRELLNLMGDERKRAEMAGKARSFSRPRAAEAIADDILKMSFSKPLRCDQ